MIISLLGAFCQGAFVRVSFVRETFVLFPNITYKVCAVKVQNIDICYILVHLFTMLFYCVMQDGLSFIY